MTWIFLRGLGRESGHWGEFPETFSQALGVQVLTLDLPGFGHNLNAPSPNTIEEIALAIRNQVPNSKAPLGLLANSLGAMVALELAHQNPGLLSHLVLINGSLASLSTPWRRLRPRAAAMVIRNLFEKDLSKREKRVIALTSNRPEIAEKTHETWLGISQARPPRRSNVSAQLVAASRYRLKPGAHDSRILVLTSKADRMVHWSCSQKLAVALGARLKIHEKAGHDLVLDDPKWVIEETTQFLKT